MTTTKKIKLRFTKTKKNFKLEESAPKFRPLRNEGFGDEIPSQADVGRVASPGTVFTDAAQTIIESGVLRAEVPLEVLASAIADAAMGLTQGGQAVQSDITHHSGGRRTAKPMGAEGLPGPGVSRD